MRRFWLFTIYGVVAIALESTILSNVPTSTIHVDLILMAVIALALAEDESGAILCVVMLGVLLDLSSSAPFGMAIFTLLVVFGFIRLIVAKISIEVWVARFIWVGLASLLCKAVTIVFALVWSGNITMVEALLRLSVPQALFDGAVGLFMIPLVMKYDGLTWEKLFKPKGLVLK